MWRRGNAGFRKRHDLRHTSGRVEIVVFETKHTMHPERIDECLRTRMGAWCAGYLPRFTPCRVQTKSNFDFEFQNSIATENQKAGIDLNLVRLTARVTCAGADGGTPSDEKKAEAGNMPVKRADSPASGARIVGRRWTCERDSFELAFTRHLRRRKTNSSGADLDLCD